MVAHSHRETAKTLRALDGKVSKLTETQAGHTKAVAEVAASVDALKVEMAARFDRLEEALARR